MPASHRVTHRTDNRGNLLDEFRGAIYVQALKKARTAGIPGLMLDPEGWSGDENDLRGFFAELVYRMGEVPFTNPHAVDRLRGIIGEMTSVCEHFGVEPLAAIPFEMAKFTRQLHEHRFGVEPRSAEQRKAELSEALDAVVVDDWGCPSGPGHDGHAHGKTPDGWRCLHD